MDRPQLRALHRKAARRRGCRSELSPFEQWLRLREQDAERTTLVTLYELTARARALRADELPRAERVRIQALALPVMYPGWEAPSDAGREQEAIELVAYDPAWPERFAAWRVRLRSALDGIVRRIDHIGSTAIPGMPAKPLIDIDVSVDEVHAAAVDAALRGAGLVRANRDDEHALYRPPPDRALSVHVHVCGAGGEWEHRHVLFRDYLRADAAARDRYAALKAELARRWRDDRIAYADAKTPFMVDTLAEAERWSGATGWRL